MTKKLFKNFTTASDNSDAKAILVCDGKIEKIGINDEFAGDFDIVHDLQGGTLLPGFIDTHTHFLHSALSFDWLNLSECTSVENVKEKIFFSRQESDWIKCYGYDDSCWKKTLQKCDLDSACPNKPVVVFKVDKHSGLLNSDALETIKVPPQIDSADVRSGFFKAKAFLWLSNILSENVKDCERLKAFEKASEIAFSKGITTVHALEGGAGWGMGDVDFLLSLKNKKIFAPNVIIYPQTVDLNWIKSRGLKRAGGCLLVDGTIGGHNAALFEPYTDKPLEKGTLYFSDKALFSFAQRAHLQGLQLSFHAIGDRAVNQIVSVYEKLFEKHPKKDHRHRIEHCELVTDQDLEKIERLEIYLAVQPVFEYLWGGKNSMYEKRLGTKRVTNRFADYFKKNINFAGGSDFDVTSLDPLLGIHSAVNHPNKSQAISSLKAIDLFTKDAAKFSFDETNIGSIAEGKKADFVVLSANPVYTDSVKIKDIKILQTFIAGERVFSSK